MSIKLKSGFEFDYDNLIGEKRVTKEDIASLMPRIKKAHEAIGVMRQTGFIRGHLSKDGQPEKVLFSQLPYIKEGNLNSPQSIKRLKDFGSSVKNNIDAVISLGIGGSYLGNKLLFDTQCGAFWNHKNIAERGGYPKVYFSGNNIDPRSTKELIEHIESSAKAHHVHTGDEKYKVMLICISKSGSTLDTMSSFIIVYSALSNNPDIELSVVAVTDPDEKNPTLLKKMAMERNWPTFAVPDGVGGRFTVFCEVGLVLAAVIGFDIEAFLEGARQMDLCCQSDDLEKNPALLNATLKFLAGQKHGRTEEVMMPYGDLESLSMWYIQLLSESLGKQFNKEGEDVCYGRTPIVAIGTRDMHSQTQQHQQGMLNKIVQFIKIAQWEDDIAIPNAFPEVQKLADIAGVTMAEALEAARQSNADALASNGRYNACITLPKLNAFHLGELLYMLALSVAYEGELADVDAFDQPGVEAYKKIMGVKLKAIKDSKK